VRLAQYRDRGSTLRGSTAQPMGQYRAGSTLRGSTAQPETPCAHAHPCAGTHPRPPARAYAHAHVGEL
jgi:hypothetical protein